MANPFIGEVMLCPYNFVPLNWVFCRGQVLPITQYTALFSLIGTFYGGNGTSTFALPNLIGRVPIAFGQAPGGSSYVMGESGGVETVTLAGTEVPSHNHLVNVAGPRSAASSRLPRLATIISGKMKPLNFMPLQPVSLGH